MSQSGLKLLRGAMHVSHLENKDLYVLKKEEPEYKFNIIGAGMIAREHMNITMLEGRATVHGLYDINPHSQRKTKEWFEQQHPEITLKEYRSLEEACHDPEADALIICTPNYTHLDILLEAVKSGKHIMIEKPMATTLEDAYEMMKIAQTYSAVLQIGLQYRYKAIYAEAIHEVLERKSIGDVKTITMVEHRVPFLDKVNQWNKFSKYSGGTLVEKCCHYFDLLNLFAQSRPAQVYAVGGMAVNFLDFEYDGEKSDVVDHACVTIVYENGVRANFNLCMFSPMFYEEIILCGDEGRLKAFENEDYLPSARPGTHLEVMRGAGAPSRIMTPCYPAAIQNSGHHGGTYYEHKYFIDNMNGLETNTATSEEGFWSIVVGAAAEESLKTGQAIHIGQWLQEKGIQV